MATHTACSSCCNIKILGCSTPRMAPHKPRGCPPLLCSILPQMPGKSAVLNHIDKKGPRPARKARALLVMGAVEPPVVREVLVTITYDGSGKPTASNMESSNIHSSKWATVPYNQRPHGVMDQVG